jgi:hypothetical protein
MIGRFNNSVVLDGLLLVEKAGSTEGSGQGLEDGFTRDGVNASKEDLDCEGACRLEADPKSLTFCCFALAKGLNSLARMVLEDKTDHEQA